MNPPGPHRLRGIEVYKGKPIFYSLGTFIMQTDQVLVQPAEYYENFGLDPLRATPADGYDSRQRKLGFLSDPEYWESALAWWDMEEGQLQELRLYPLQLGFGLSRSRRGRPSLAEGRAAKRIIAGLGRLCEPWGTHLEWHEAGYGVMRW
jgi:poly-gamma-glutamate synthesis protein (capsule biosynthesis protein)